MLNTTVRSLDQYKDPSPIEPDLSRYTGYLTRIPRMKPQF
jgi:hypothetical protein